MQKTFRKHKFFPKMPRIAEISNTHCGPATLAMLLGNSGVRVGQNKIVQVSSTIERIRNNGMAIWEMDVATKKLSNLVFWLKYNATTDDIKELLRRGYPVGIDWQGDFKQYSDKDDGHYSVVTNISKSNKSIFIADTYRHFAGRDRRIDLKFFEKRWWEFNEVKNVETGLMEEIKIYHLMFIVAKKNDTFPVEMGMIVV